MGVEIRIARGVGKRLKAERNRLGLSQEELAARIGVTKITVFAYEHETSPMTVPTLVKLAEAGVSLSKLLEGSSPRFAPAAPGLIKKLATALARHRNQIIGDPSYDDEEKLETLLHGFAAATELSSVDEHAESKPKLVRKRG